MVKTYPFERVITRDFICPFELEILRLQTYFYSKTSANLQIVNIEHLRIWKSSLLNDFYIIYKGMVSLQSRDLILAVHLLSGMILTIESMQVFWLI